MEEREIVMVIVVMVIVVMVIVVLVMVVRVIVKRVIEAKAQFTHSLTQVCSFCSAHKCVTLSFCDQLL